MRKVALFVLAAALALGIASLAGAAIGDTLVTVGSPPTPFSQNKQNEPAIAVDANHPNILVAGSNDKIDKEACNAGADNTCPFTPGVGVSGVYFSFDAERRGPSRRIRAGARATARASSGPTRVQPGPAARSARCRGTSRTGWSQTATRRSRSARGPAPTASFSWSNGSRLYYANLTSNFGATRDEQTFKGFEAIAVSRTDNVQAAAAAQRQERLDAAGGDLQAVEHHVLRQGAGLGRQRRRPVRSSATSTSAGRRSGPGEGQRRAGAAAGGASPATAATPGRSTRSRPPRTTASATRRTAARSAPTATATPTSSASAPSRPSGQRRSS